MRGLGSRLPGIETTILPARQQASTPQASFQLTSLPDGTPWLEYYRSEDGYLLRFPGLADFMVSADGRDIVSIPVPGLSPATLDHLYLNQVLPLALSRQQRVVLHASAVRVGNAAVAFVGESGRGKSTLAAAFARAGHPFLTDDGLQVLCDAAGCTILPGPASLRLWQDTGAALVPADAPLADAIDYSSKQRLLADSSLPHCAEALPLQALYVLGEGTATAAAFATLAPRASMLVLLQHCFLLDITEDEMLRQYFPKLAEVARQVPLFALDYPREFSELPAVIAAVTEHAARNSQRA
jgi:predicted ATPase